MKSVFSPVFQSRDLESKIISALERISEAFRILLWSESKKTYLSPIQIQILIFLFFHTPERRNVTYISREFGLTKATVSDSLNSLIRKKLISKHRHENDRRSYTLTLTRKGEETAGKLSFFANRLKEPVSGMSEIEREKLYSSLLKIIRNLIEAEIITVQRMCFNCRFFEEKNQGIGYCNLLKMSIKDNQIRIDCPEHEAA